MGAGQVSPPTAPHARPADPARLACWRQRAAAAGLALSLALACAGPAHAWSAASDEANRQRTMQRMRDDAARADRAAIERASRQQAQNERDAAERARAARTAPDSGTARASPARQITAPGSVDDDDGAVPRDGNPDAIRVAIPSGVPPQVATTMMRASAGQASAQFQLARMHYAGHLLPRDDVQARHWLTAAARQGHAGAQGLLGHFLSRGLGGAANADEAERWLHQAAERGDAFGQVRYSLAVLVRNEANNNFDARTLLPYLQAAAQGGEHDAASILADLYGGYKGVPDEPAQRLRWLTVAAEHDDARAMTLLAGLLLQGEGPVRADPAQSLRWLQRGAALQHPGATAQLAAYHFNGMAGLAASAEQGLVWGRRAADLGDARSQAEVGMLLLQRDPPDLAAGVAYVKRSAAAADAMGLDALARLHVDGLGVPRDLQRAVQLLRQSLQAGGNPPDPQTLALLATPELQQAARLLDTAARR